MKEVLSTVLPVALLEKPFIKLKYCLLCLITNSDKVSRQWVLGEAGTDVLRWWKGHLWAYGCERAGGSWCVRRERAAGRVAGALFITSVV